MKQLPALDAEWAARARREAARGRVLRYVVTATAASVSARLRRCRVEPDRRACRDPQPGGVHDARYRTEPLVISGPGAGRGGHGRGDPQRHLFALGAVMLWPRSSPITNSD